MSLQVLKQKTKNNNPYVPITSYISPHPVAQITGGNTCNSYTEVGYSTNSFSIVGAHRNDRGGVGSNYKMSKSGTPFKGIYPYNYIPNSGIPLMNAGPGIVVPASQANYTKKGNISPANRIRQLSSGCHTTKTTGALDASNYLWIISNASKIKRTNALGFVYPNYLQGTPESQGPYKGCACLELNGIESTGIPFNGQHIY
jgi:hypothetical protein